MLTQKQIAWRLRKRLERLVKAAIPELAGPVYFVFSHEGVDLGWAGGCVCRDGDAIAREVYGKKWRGRGPTVFLKWDFHWEMQWIRGLPGDFIGWLAAGYHAIIAHEVAHLIADTPVFQPASDDALPSVEVVLETLRGPAAFEAFDQICNGHGVDYWRAFAHVAARICAVTGESGAKWMLNSEAYGLSGGDAYFAALGDELRELGASKIADILKLPPPASLFQLWRSDTAAIVKARRAKRLMAASGGEPCQ